MFVRKRACFHPFRHPRQHYVPTGVLSEHSFVKLKLQSSQTGLRFRPVLTKNVSLRYTSQKTLHSVPLNKKSTTIKRESYLCIITSERLHINNPWSQTQCGVPGVIQTQHTVNPEGVPYLRCPIRMFFVKRQRFLSGRAEPAFLLSNAFFGERSSNFLLSVSGFLSYF